jgi:putative phage-type endonuclease
MEAMQQTEEWRVARCGSIGASQIHLALSKTKSGWGASRDNLASQIIIERLTDVPTETYQSKEMLWGIEKESEAKSLYGFFTDSDMADIGFVKHPTIEWTGASPDSLVGADGLLEIKCPNSATHLEFLLGGSIERKYVYQMAWQMACTGRDWCDFMSYDPRFPVKLQSKIIRVERDDALIAELESEVRIFLDEVADKVERLRGIQ